MPAQMDRPYAGWQFISFGFGRGFSRKASDGFEAEIGVVGPQSGMGNMHVWWHKAIGLGWARGWSNQIGNEVAVNLRYHYSRQFNLYKGFDLLSVSELAGGTLNNRLSQQLTIRAGDMNDQRGTVFNHSRLGVTEPKQKEFFFYASVQVNYVFTNLFIEGSMLDGHPSPVTREIEHVVFRQTYGLMSADSRNSFMIGFTFLSKEIATADTHGYATLVYAYRF